MVWIGWGIGQCLVLERDTLLMLSRRKWVRETFSTADTFENAVVISMENLKY